MYSYKEEQNIDFTELMEDKIFGIFGSVGSGKSTILEAVLFSLYGKTERLNQSGENRNYNMMNLKSKELLIDFEFLSNDKNSYRIISSLKRQNKNFDKVSSPERSFYILDQGEWIPISQEDIENAVGFNYDNFKRTVIIPQGKFQEFLSLTDADRGKMLKEIFGLDRFELSRQATALLSQTREELSRMKGNIEMIQLENNHLDMDDLKNRITQKKSAIQEYKNRQSQLIRESDILKKLQSLTKELKAGREQLFFVEKEMAATAEMKKKLFLYNNYTIWFSSLLHTLDLIQANQVKIQTNLDADKKAREGLELQLQQIRSEYEHLRKEEANIPELERKVQILQAVNAVLRLQKSKMEQEQSLTKGNSFVSQKEIELKSLEDQMQSLNNEIERLNTEKLSVQDISRINVVLSSVQQFLQIQFKMAEIQRKIETLKASMAEVYKSEDPAIFIQQVETEIGVVSEKKQQALIKIELQKMRDHLVEGEPCPLCGSSEHPSPVCFDADDHSVITEFDTVVRNLNKRLTDFKDKINELINLENTHADLQKEEASMAEKLVLPVSGDVRGDKIQDYKSLLEFQLGEQDVLEKNIKQKLEQSRHLYSNIQSLKSILLRSGERLQIIVSEINNLEGQIKVYSNLISEGFIQENPDIDTNITQISDIQLNIQKIRQNLIVTTAKKEAVEKSFAEVEQRIQIYQDQLRNLQTEQTNISGRINVLIREKNIEISDVEFILQWGKNINIEAETERISKIENEYHILKDRIGVLEQETGGISFNEEEYNLFQEKLVRLTQELDGLISDLGGLENTLKKGEELLKILGELSKKYEKQQLREHNLTTISQMFRANGFVHYVSAIYLKNLVEIANQRFFYLTKNRLKIELDETNGFQVRDYMNNGHLRHIKTLSGGQIFQASLCLALGLAESVRRFDPGKDNFFFLDEGFGTLDKESMYMVFETLKMLRREGRVVGIISHVDELQQEIGMHLRIANSEEHGSIITKSWS